MVQNQNGTVTTTVAFRCDDDFYQRILAAADKDRRTIASFVKMIVEDHLPEHEVRLGLVEPSKGKAARK